MQYSALIESVILAVREAGAEIMNIYNSEDLGVEYKEDESPLTRADMLSHKVLKEALTRLNQGPILSEEGASTSWEHRREWSRYWLVDPIDGTKEFIKRNGEFTVNVALIEDGHPVMGVVYAPALDVLYYGDTKNGAYKQLGGAPAEKIHVARLPLNESKWRVVGSRSHQSDDFKAFVEKFDSAEIVSMGSSLKLCMVADGQADIYPRLGLTSEWDTGAAQAVVEAAGGQVINWETKTPLRYNTKDSLLNPYFIVCAEPADVWFSL